jgi:hypothetical protein
MRVSIFENDPGFATLAPNTAYETYLDGVKISEVVTADEEEGMVVVMAPWEDQLRNTAAELLTQTKYGKVVIVPKPINK